MLRPIDKLLQASIACILLLMLPQNVLAASVSVQDVRVGLHGDRSRIVFDIDGPSEHRFFTLEGPERVVLELHDAQLSLASDPDFRGTNVMRLRSGFRDGDILRIVLDLEGGKHRFASFALGPDEATGRGNRLVVDIWPNDNPDQGATSTAAEARDSERRSYGEIEGELAGTAVEGARRNTDAGERTPTTGKDRESPNDQSKAYSANKGNDHQPDLSTSPNTAVGQVDEGTDDLDSFFPTKDSVGFAPNMSGYLDTSAAYTFAAPEHWSKLRARLEVAATGRLSESVKYKLAARLDGDAAYIVEDDFYPSAVIDDQRFEAQIREFYLDFGSGSWAHRVGRQHIVWGEMVGLFLADVVSARDLREFYLQEFEAMRIPQWAWNSQFFSGDHTLELVYIPVPSVDKIGEPGADFYPYGLPSGTPVRDDRPDIDVSEFNWGVRASTLQNGWSLSAYYYDSVSAAPTLVSDAEGFSLQYDPIEQIGGTFSKDFGGFVLKGEAVYTMDRRFQTQDPTLLITSDALDWVIGATVPVGDWRWDFQLYGRRTDNHDPRVGFDADEYGATLLMNYALGSRLELEMLALVGLNREDYLLRPKFVWRFRQDWRLQFGADVFGGDDVGLFGPYDDRDRIYFELKRWF